MPRCPSSPQTGCNLHLLGDMVHWQGGKLVVCQQPVVRRRGGIFIAGSLRGACMPVVGQRGRVVESAFCFGLRPIANAMGRGWSATTCCRKARSLVTPRRYDSREQSQEKYRKTRSALRTRNELRKRSNRKQTRPY